MLSDNATAAAVKLVVPSSFNSAIGKLVAVCSVLGLGYTGMMILLNAKFSIMSPNVFPMY